ncbi:CNPV030 ankyrin repeat protein [Canarypox virus]|uniref:CNPV030 ankyrin repeat protein n=1 Tax=Canarypox virus TaxID=44088 RepID=Q6VZW7_CNPV|nr:CNPV030 ankyrin repeat protein [Canarypox virus]AAR83376.1 CNPV030 ankyrin repeat protein [Canarypox virus]AWD84506.1 ankyrin repeat protein [Canarypox virus]
MSVTMDLPIDHMSIDNINEYNKNGYTRLYIEVAMKKRKNVDRLLYLGADPNLASADSYCPLHIAVRNGSLKIIRSLLKYGANINQECHEGDTALMMAISLGNYTACKTLLDNNADPNYVNYYGIVPLIRAIICEKPDIVRLLLDRGANCNHLITKNGRTYTALESLRNCFFKDNSSSLSILISEIVISTCREGLDIDGFNRNVEIISRDNILHDIALKCKMELNFMYTRGIGDKSIFKLCIMKEHDKINKNLLVSYLDKLIETRDKMTMYRYYMNDIINIGSRRRELLTMAMNVKYYTLDEGINMHWKNNPFKERIQILQNLSDNMLTKLILNDALNIHK